MFGRNENRSSLAKVTAENRFSLPYLRQLHQQLVANKAVTEENKMLVIEILRVIAEMVVYGDNKSEILFDFFCEKNMLSLFLEIMWTEGGCPNAVHIQILQTLSILINCVKNNTSLYYLLSNNYVNEIINYPHNFDNDESLRDQFASFMKSVSLRLNKQTVQFFFIEETGGFPLLTRAIEAMYLDDNMVRIACQTTILNIFRVQDFRSRAYALQEEVMFSFFTVINSMMKNQFESMIRLCQQLSALSSLASGSEDAEDEKSRSISIENQITDLLINSEDWLYYVQDVFDLRIMILRRALVLNLMNNFMYPILLPCCSQKRMYSIENNQDIPQVSSSYDSSNVEYLVAVTYLSQILRIIADKMLRRAILTALIHPNSRESRRLIQTRFFDLANDDSSSLIVTHPAEASEPCQANLESDPVQIESPEHGDSSREEKPPCTSSLSDANGTRGAESAIESNSYREAFFSLFENGLEKSLVGTNFMRVLSESFFNAAKSIDREDEDACEEVRLDFQSLQSLSVWPVDKALGINGGELPKRLVYSKARSLSSSHHALPRSRKSWGTATEQPKDRRKRSQSGEEEMEVEPDELDKCVDCHVIDPDILPVQVLEEIRLFNLANGSTPCICFIETMGDMLASPAEYPLCGLHEAVHAIYGFGMGAYVANQMSRPNSNGWLRVCLDVTRKAVSKVCSRLLPRLSTPMGDMILNILQEELFRVKGRKWSLVSNKVSKEVLLLLPALSKHSRSQSCDLECNVPVSQTEAVRREIQVFLLLRSLHSQLWRMFSATGAIKLSMDDVTNGMVEGSVIGFTDTGLIPPHLMIGHTFDMRGKKFLDAMVYESSKLPTTMTSPVGKGAASSAAAGALSPEESSTLLASSIFGFGFLGGNATSAESFAANPKISKKSKSKTLGEIFFVQSNALFLLVEPHDDEFRVWLTTPIHQTDVSVSQSKKKMTVFVRSWEKVEHMDLVGSEIEQDQLSSGLVGGNSPTKKFPELLRPRQQGSLYKLTMMFDNETSCHLAAQHIESKRHKMRTNRLLFLKTILEAWSVTDLNASICEPSENIKVT